MKLIAYLRQSNVEKAKESTISAKQQRSVIEEWAGREGDVELIWNDRDLGVSGAKDWRKRGLGIAIEEIRAGRAGGIVVKDQSRLTREGGLAFYEILTELDRAGARLVCVEDGTDTAKGDQELNLGIRALMAREEWKKRKAGWRKCRDDARERGVHIGPLPTGYERPQVQAVDANGEPRSLKDGTPVMESLPLVPGAHAGAITELFRRRASGANWAQVVRLLEEAGVPNGRGEPFWTKKAAQRIIANRTYLGEVRDGERVTVDCHPPLTDEITFKRAQYGKINGVAPRTGVSLLAGILRCATCGEPLSTTGKDGRYRCKSRRAGAPCPAPASCRQAEAEEAVSRAFLELVSSSFYVKAVVVDVGGLEQALATATNRYEAWLAQEDAMDDDPEAWQRRRRELKAVRDEAAEALHDAQPEALEGRETIGMRWDGMDVAERRRWLAQFAVRVVVERGGGWFGHRAIFHWNPEPASPELVEPARVEDLLAVAAEAFYGTGKGA